MHLPFRFFLIAALAVVGLALETFAQIAPPRPVKGACPDSCVFVPGASGLSRHCPNPAPLCNLGACQCTDVLGEAKWINEEWRGAFHECYCLPPGSLLGPANKFLWMHCYYEWRVDKRTSLVAGDEHTFDFHPDPTSYVHFFDLGDLKPDSTLQQSTALFHSLQGFAGTVVFEELGVGTSNPNEELWEVKSVNAQIGSSPLMTYMTGPNQIDLLPNSPKVVIYDSVQQTIRSVVDIECRLTNRMFPSGVSFAIEISMENQGSHWRAFGRGRAGFPPSLTHDYDAGTDSLTLSVTNATPNSFVVLGSRIGCLGDVNLNRKVDQSDLLAVEQAFGQYSTPGESPADVNFDASVDDLDYDIVKQQLGCSDVGTTPIPGCVYFADIEVQSISVLPTDALGQATLTIPTAGAGNNALYFQIVELNTCETSNVVRMTTY